MSPLRSVCVFCGARAGSDPAHLRTARATGEMVAAQGWRLVYGAGDIGLMGEVARSAIATGAPTLGIIPSHLIQAERSRVDQATLIVTQTMHERKMMMFTNADAIVLLPGGAGSLDEFFEVLTWAQIGLHAKPILVVNSNGYWTPLRALLDHVVAHGFADPSVRELFTMVNDVEALCAALQHAFAEQ